MIPIPPWLIKVGSKVLAVLLLLLCLWMWGKHKENVGYDKATKEYSDKALIAQQDYLKRVMAIEAASRAEVDAEVSKLIVKMEQGYAKRDKVIDDLRAGNLRLRKHWQGCPNAVPETSSDTGSSDDSADLREADAGNLVRLAAQCDATIETFQAIERGRQEK